MTSEGAARVESHARESLYVYRVRHSQPRVSCIHVRFATTHLLFVN